MPLLKPQRSPFVFPAGFHPSVDQTHPAMPKVRLSAVAVPNGNFVNLLTGARGTPSAALTTPVVAGIGRGVLLSANTNNVQFANSFSDSPTTFTGAAIFQLTTITSQTSVFFSTVNTTSGAGRTSFQVVNGSLDLFSNNGTLATPGFTCATNTPYFAAVSSSTSAQNFVLVNLLTGQIQTAATTITLSFPTPGTYTLGFSGSPLFGGYLSHVMYSQTLLSAAQLAAWAADPWSFWYPNRDPLALSRVGAAASNAATLATTEARDTAAFNASSKNTATLATTEARDTAAFNVTQKQTAALATTEARDVAAFNVSNSSGAVTTGGAFPRSLRNPLSYPGGAPSLNAAHVLAGSGLRLAAVATAQGGMLDLVSGRMATVATPADLKYEVNTLGPTVYPTVSGTASTAAWTPQAAFTTEQYRRAVVGGIFSPRFVTGPQTFVMSAFTGTTGFGVGIGFSSGSVITLNWSGTFYSPSSFPTLVSGHNYFVIGSFSQNGTYAPFGKQTQQINSVLLDMTTGQMWADHQTGHSLGTISTGGSYASACIGGGAVGDGRVACTFINATAFLSLSELMAIAQDPWSLWYTPFGGTLAEIAGTSGVSPVTLSLATTEAADRTAVQVLDGGLDTHDGDDGWLYHPDTPWMKRWRELRRRSKKVREDKRKPKEAVQELREIVEEAAELIEAAPAEATEDAPVAQVDVLPLLFARDVNIEPLVKAAEAKHSTDEGDIAELGRLMGMKFSTVRNSAGKIVAVEEE